MRIKGFYAFLPFMVALLLRLYPFIVSGLPFSVDAWSIIRNTELLLEKTPIRLGDQVFDSYNNYWPANSLFSAIISEVTGLPPMLSMAIFFPVVGALSILIFYVTVKRVCGKETSFLASLIFATGFTHVILTAGVTKETFASPIYLLLFLVFLHPKIGGWKKTFLFSLTAFTLVMAHHYATFVTLTIFFWIALAEQLQKARRGQKLGGQGFTLISIMVLIVVLYYGFYANQGFKYDLPMSDFISAASYQIIAFALALYFSFKPSTYSKRSAITIAAVTMIVGVLITFLATKKPLVPGSPVLPPRYIFYSLPLLLASPLVAVGLRCRKKNKMIIPFFFWFTSILAIEAYSIFSNVSSGLMLSFRTVNFLWPPLAVFFAAAVNWMFKVSERVSAKILLIFVSFLILASSSYNVYATVDLQERYLGYFWLYTDAEYQAAAWVAKSLETQIVAGDMKFSYLLEGYFNLNVDVFQGFRYLTGEGSEPEILVTYDQMKRNGYVLYSGISVDLPQDWIEETQTLNIIYSNGFVNIHHGATDD